ncbi:putative metal-binding hydrolase [Thiomonas arsenitoxydans]|uniref:Hydroxyacylglutathione hydrolase n=1 Tax=Thiomonas arsenitoxydans (strain DSM 22701 / CIP 110005 / 3As) TaxID=426114 RepID=D6CVM7_THIA3|nr:MBL fold metallo-hydrolase [Thiomonas arsenitoxydans]CAZ86808.1 putative Hydroxyacylglutathione hydrolase [Thiomonas arsenitoxydans]CQR28363.1 putative metal-binding hydrolase [Thiomonas arsenitoxydans]CQR28513.1 putative metal-binding hydrolase [Thiomonas arsenitoxydans]CQR28516.1 putative metal-binding hydrolase [Thiomonas arsenitoxydans]CQR30831.1 putative metal-binding hydrolase [Thiomonas arsenitoxydans]
MLRYRILPVTAFAQNTCLVWDDATQEAVFTDPGGEVDRLLQAVVEAGVTLRAVWLTHAHIDHAGAAAEVAQRAGVPIIGPHPGDQFWIDALPQQAQRFGFPPAKTFTPDRWLADGDTLQLGSLPFTVRHCPGHTPGHVVFHQPEARRCWVGDVLFAGSIGRTDFPGGNHQQLLDSITGKLWPMGDDTVFIPGHGPESTFGEQRRSNPYVRGT